MKKPIVILADPDEEYLIHLELKLIQDFGDKIDLRIMSDEEYIKAYFKEPQKVDLMIINKNYIGEWIDKHNVSIVFLLSETKNIYENCDYLEIYKYSSIKEVYNDITSHPKTKALIKTLTKNKTRLIMLYSPAGGVGKTTLSMCLCAAFEKAHKKAIYISTETLQSYNLTLNATKYSDDILAMNIKNKSPELSNIVDNYIENTFISFLCPFEQSTTSLNISLNDYIYLIDVVKNKDLYDYIIIDSSNDLTTNKTKLMSFCDKVMIITTQDKIALSKTESLVKNIDCSDISRYQFICNMYKESQFNYIKHYKNIFRSNKLDIVPLLEFDQFVAIDKLASTREIQDLVLNLI